jgi:hypothetical protein
VGSKLINRLSILIEDDNGLTTKQQDGLLEEARRKSDGTRRGNDDTWKARLHLLLMGSVTRETFVNCVLTVVQRDKDLHGSKT